MVRIFHLEDDNSLRDILKVAISTTDPNVEVEQFPNSDDAVNYIRQHAEDIDLFVLDIRVPGALDGMGVAQVIRDLGSPAPIIVASAYEKPCEDLFSSLECEWMPKPWNFDVMVGLVPRAYKYRKAKKNHH